MIWNASPYLPGDLSMRDALGFIPDFVDDDDPRPAAEQIGSAYQHGGGWSPMQGFTLAPETLSLLYPGDPVMKPWAFAMLRTETIVVYPHGWVAIIQPGGSFEVARLD